MMNHHYGSPEAESCAKHTERLRLRIEENLQTGVPELTGAEGGALLSLTTAGSRHVCESIQYSNRCRESVGEPPALPGMAKNPERYLRGLQEGIHGNAGRKPRTFRISADPKRDRSTAGHGGRLGAKAQCSQNHTLEIYHITRQYNWNPRTCIERFLCYRCIHKLIKDNNRTIRDYHQRLRKIPACERTRKALQRLPEEFRTFRNQILFSRSERRMQFLENNPQPVVTLLTEARQRHDRLQQICKRIDRNLIHGPAGKPAVLRNLRTPEALELHHLWEMKAQSETRERKLRAQCKSNAGKAGQTSRTDREDWRPDTGIPRTQRENALIWLLSGFSGRDFHAALRGQSGPGPKALHGILNTLAGMLTHPGSKNPQSGRHTLRMRVMETWNREHRIVPGWHNRNNQYVIGEIRKPPAPIDPDSDPDSQDRILGSYEKKQREHNVWGRNSWPQPAWIAILGAAVRRDLKGSAAALREPETPALLRHLTDAIESLADTAEGIGSSEIEESWAEWRFFESTATGITWLHRLYHSHCTLPQLLRWSRLSNQPRLRNRLTHLQQKAKRIHRKQTWEGPEGWEEFRDRYAPGLRHIGSAEDLESVGKANAHCIAEEGLEAGISTFTYPLPSEGKIRRPCSLKNPCITFTLKAYTYRPDESFKFEMDDCAGPENDSVDPNGEASKVMKKLIRYLNALPPERRKRTGGIPRKSEEEDEGILPTAERLAISREALNRVYRHFVPAEIMELAKQRIRELETKYGKPGKPGEPG